MRGILSFNRVPLNVVAVTVLASYAAQFLALIQGFPLWGIAMATLLPWLPVFTLEMMWRYRHYQWLALFEVVLISQIGHFIEHLVQMYQIHVLGLAAPPPGASSASSTWNGSTSSLTWISDSTIYWKP